jgi:hypothetical protein
MDPDQAESSIRSFIEVTPQRVTVAKSVVFNASLNAISCDDLVRVVLEKNGIVVPSAVVLHETVDTVGMLKAVAESISWKLATIEATWQLVHAGHLVSLADSRTLSSSVSWTTVVPGSGGQSSGWQFQDFEIPMPSRVRRAPSTLIGSKQYLTDPELYLATLAVPGLHDDVRAALRESIRCFRQELYTAALAMLGKASEGAWLDLAAELLAFAAPTAAAKYAKQQTTLDDPMQGPQKKIDAVLTIFNHQEDFGSIATKSNVRPADLRAAAVWSDTVRDSRNTLHFGVSPATPNTYEKVTVLLLAAVPNIRLLYRLKESARP